MAFLADTFLNFASQVALMVLEHLFPEDWLERKHRYAFLLAVVYSTVGIVLARLLFAANSGIVSVIFTALFLMPSLKKLLVKEERGELQEHRFSFRELWRDNRQAIQVYGTIFLGIYATYTLYTFLLPLLGFHVSTVFREQLAFDAGLRGQAFDTGTFLSIFMNNWWVLLACFLVALIAGDGALFFIAWNASTWGAIFGFRAVAAGSGAFGPFLNLLVIVVITLPHALLEGGAYILAAIAGGVLSDDVGRKRDAMSRFLLWFFAALVLFVILWFLFGTLFPPLVAHLLDILTVLILLHLLSFIFEDRRHREVFLYNYRLFLVALLIFLLGAIVETLVVGHSTLLQPSIWLRWPKLFSP